MPGERQSIDIYMDFRWLGPIVYTFESTKNKIENFIIFEWFVQTSKIESW